MGLLYIKTKRVDASKSKIIRVRRISTIQLARLNKLGYTVVLA